MTCACDIHEGVVITPCLTHHVETKLREISAELTAKQADWRDERHGREELARANSILRNKLDRTRLDLSAIMFAAKRGASMWVIADMARDAIERGREKVGDGKEKAGQPPRP